MKALVGAAVAAIIAGTAMLGIGYAQAADRPDCHPRVTPPLPLPDGWTIVYHCGPPHVAGISGMTRFSDRVIDVWPAVMDTADQLRDTIAHETLHVYDWLYLDSAERQTWRTMRGLQDAPWWHDQELTAGAELDRDRWAQAAAEDWAEVGAACLTGSPVGRRFDPPTPQQCQFVREATHEGVHS